MLKRITEIFNGLDDITKKIMKYGLLFSLSFCIIASLILFTYEAIYALPDLYYIGLKMFQTGLFFITEFIVCGIAVDRIKKQII